jgi:DNA-binding CsgD family transcriptional regulator
VAERHGISDGQVLITAGASGFLVKDTEPADLATAVRVVAQGDPLISPSMTRRLVAEFASQAKEPRPAAGLDAITRREREVMALVADGLTNDEIARKLYLSPATVRTHVSRAMTKLGVRDRAQLVVLAYETGLVRPNWTTWMRETGFDSLPAEWLSKIASGSAVVDSVSFQQTLADGLLDVRPMFASLDGDHVAWSHGERERVDAVILATGYRPGLGYLRELGALDPLGAPLHVGGISTTHPGLVYLGLKFQRSFASNTLRGVSADASAVIAPMVAWIRDAPRSIGLTPEGTPPVIPVHRDRAARIGAAEVSAAGSAQVHHHGVGWPDRLAGGR